MVEAAFRGAEHINRLLIGLQREFVVDSDCMSRSVRSIREQQCLLRRMAKIMQGAIQPRHAFYNNRQRAVERLSREIAEQTGAKFDDV